MKEILTDLEIAKIEAFNKDEVMREAVRKVLLQYMYSSGVIVKGEKHNPLKNRALAIVDESSSNEQMGAQLRALWEGVQALEKGFDDLSSIRLEVETVESPYNEAV